MTDTNTKVRSLILTALMVVSVFGGSIAFAGSAAAAANGSASVSVNTEAGATGTYEVSLDVGPNEAGSLNGFEVDFSADGNFDGSVADVGTSDIETFTVGGTTVNDVSGVSSSNNGQTLTLTAGGSSALNAGDTIVLKFNDVTNPSDVETYDVSFVQNPQSSTNAVTGSYTISTSTSPVSSGDADTTFDSASIRWQGQTMFVKDNSNADQTLALRRVTGDTTTTLVREVTLDGNGEAIIDSSTLQQGTYVFSDPDSSDFLLFGSNGVETGTNSDDGVAGVEIAEQSLTIDPSSDTVTSDGSSVDFDVDSNRGGSYNIIVDSSDYTDAELASVITDATDYESDESGVRVSSGQGDTITATFPSDAKNGEFTLDFSVEDTTAADSATFTVSDPAEGQVSLEEGIVSEERGDVGQITVNLENTDEATIILGGDSVNYEAQIELEDGGNGGDADGTVTVNLNTFRADEGSAAFTPADTDDSVTASATKDGPGIMPDGPLATADYEIVLQDSAGDDVGVGTFVVTERSTDSMQLWTAADLPTDADQEAVYDALEAGAITQDSTIAFQDELVHQIEVSGIYGALVDEMDANNSDAEAALLELANGDASDPLTLSATQAGNFPNSEPLTVDFSELDENGGLNVVADDANNTVFVAVDTTNLFDDSDPADPALTRGGTELGAGDVEPADLLGQTFDVEFGVLAQSALVSGDEDELVTASFSVEERTAELNGGDDITVEAASGQEITGTTNVAPGTEINIRARASGSNPFLKTANGVTVGADGTFSGTFDFSDVASDTTFTVTASTSQSFAETVTIDGTVGEAAATPTPEPATDTPTPEPATDTPTPTPEPATDTPTPEPATDTPTEGGPTETETSGSQPGFGGAVAIVALAGAALIALRRGN
ncbi:PGF-CTERM sorting domain-containing protein [Halosegnis rubeus]|uniref:PGF-CTERM sorting domain-containing protein n=1 Tax=Halosegnis rubeus TaxID=2212850 RepID=A0A5N5UI74_9EURY|nr:PGF-CTERM sorting domain-containing protein [Halosegnis rubeus]